jgi:hypothetical protein
MHREWNPRAFFRHLTPDVARALASHLGITLDVKSGATSSERLYAAWKILDEETHHRLEPALRLVNDLCTASARSYLVTLAQERWSKARAEWLPFVIAWSTHDLAVRLFIDNVEALKALHRSYGVDMLEHLKEYQGKYVADVVPSVDRKSRMKASMLEHFRSESRGENCHIEDFVNDEKLALFVYAEDEVTPFDRFNNVGQLEPEWHRPVFRLAAVFNFETCTLLVKAPRKSEREKLRDLFAEIFVGNKNYFEDPAESPRYDFDVLADPKFDFPTHGADQIERVSVLQLTARPADRDIRRVTVELEPGLPHERMLRAVESLGLRVGSDSIDGARLLFVFEGSGRSRQRTVSIANPNTSNLRDTDRDRVIRRCLRDWNIDADRAPAAMGSLALQGAAE